MLLILLLNLMLLAFFNLPEDSRLAKFLLFEIEFL